jgi:predicted SAM-dependent methyltransferase
VENSAFDFVYAFSVFTHLLQTEILLYTHDIFQKLKPGGLFLFSFLEMDKHWTIFVNDAVRHLEYGQPTPHLNMFLSRHQIEEIAEKIGFKVVRYIESDGDVYSIGQTVVMFKKP